jgi:hypothetical protein
MKIADHVYVINLDRRTDRLEKIQERFDNLGLDFERVSAIDGKTLDIELPEQTPEKRWNKAAYALALTTIGILKDAEEKGYKNILIFEDDVDFVPLFDTWIDAYIEELDNRKYDFAFLGYTLPGMCTSSPMTPRWDKVYSMVSCHAYIINKHMISNYRKMLEKLDNPIDYYVNIIVGGRLNSLCAIPLAGKKLVFQENGYSDIEEANYNVEFTR